MYSQSHLIRSPLIGHFCLVRHYPQDTPHLQPMLYAPPLNSLQKFHGRIRRADLVIHPSISDAQYPHRH